MLFDYSDIWGRIPTPPLWWFEGVPRYEPFHPEWLDGREAALVHSKCQICGTDFMVGVCSLYANQPSLSDQIEKDGTIWLRDPPLVFCCQGGHATSSLAIEVIEFWKRGKGNDYRIWSRVPEFEKKLSDWHPDLEARALPREKLKNIRQHPKQGVKRVITDQGNRLTRWLRGGDWS